MTIKNLYRYKGEGGTVDTTVLLPMEYEAMHRLIADEGMMLTDGEQNAFVIDIPVADLEKWTEIEAPTEDEELFEEGEPTVENESVGEGESE